MSRRSSGFALTDVVVMILILGILAAVTLPAYVKLQQSASQSAEDAVIANARIGITLFFAESAARQAPEFPQQLDDAAEGVASEDNPFFTAVLQQEGVTRDWRKTGQETYVSPAGNIYKYDARTGRLLKWKS